MNPTWLRYWLAWNASDWVYQDHDERGNGAEWILDCGGGVQYVAKAQVRLAAQARAPLQFSTFDVEVTGGALAEPWKIYVLAFRGSVILQDWVANLSVPINFDSPLADLAVGVHAGWHAYVSDRTHHEKLRTAIAGIESDEILVAGHSLGGALSQVASLFLWREYQTQGSPLYNRDLIASNTRCVTFGSPAPFVEKKSNDHIAKRLRTHARVWMEKKCVNFVNNNDPVCRLPFDPSFALNILSSGFYSWGGGMSERASESSLTKQLRQYEHFCAHIILNREEVAFEPQNPMAGMVRERGPIVRANEHDLEEYQKHLFSKLWGEITKASMPIAQVVSFRPRGPAPDVARPLRELRACLDTLPDLEKDVCLKPFRRVFESTKQICNQLEKIQTELNQLSSQADEARSLHKNVADQFRNLGRVKSYIEATNNSILVEEWEDVS